MNRPVRSPLAGRRLDTNPSKKLKNPERHIRSLERWSKSLAGYYPTPEDFDDRGWWYERIPIFQKVIEPPHTTAELQARAAQLLIDAAWRVAEAKPAEALLAQIYAFLSFPNLFDSMIEVALRPNPVLFFNGEQGTGGRSHFDGGWVETFPTDADLIERLGLRIPQRFQVRSIGIRRFEKDWMDAPIPGTEWAIGELEPV